MASTDSSHVDNVEVAHEQSDVNIRAILAVAAGLAVTGVVIHLVIFVVFLYFQGREARQSEARAFPLAPLDVQMPRAPKIQPRPAEDLRDLRVQEDQVLATYAWVDEKAGVARIPIDRAMQLVVERGLPVRTPQQTVSNK